MRILVTGATGFIGNYVVEELLKRGHEVIATSRGSENAKKFSWYAKVTYVEADLLLLNSSAFQDFLSLFHHPEKVIHLAWPGLPNYKELFHFEKNLPSDYLFLKNLVENGVKDITVTGTCFEYGMRDGCLSEEMISDPQNSYGLAKDTLRKFLQQLQLHTAFDLKWARLFYMYGKGQNPGSLFSQLDTALENNESVFNMSGGEQERDYLPVEDVALYLVEIALQNITTGIVNCCSGIPITVKQMVTQYLVKEDRAINLNFGVYPYSQYEPMSFWGDNRKLLGILKK